VPSAQDFSCIRHILELFAGTSGLATNLDKCMITPIRCSSDDVEACRLQEFPTKYIGAPLALSRLSHTHEQALVDAVAARIPTWKSSLLTTAGRATLTRTALSAIPVHVSICCSLLSWAIEEIDRRRRTFLWAGTKSVAGGKCRVAWSIVCSPREHGSLGLPDLRTLGFALRLCWEWLRRTQPDAAWTLLPSKPERTIDNMFRASVTV
jgi:hypothetical protein